MLIYGGIVFNWGFKRKIKIAYYECLNVSGEVNSYNIYFNTSLFRSGVEVVRYYQRRFQMEFNFRDAKKYAGLENCQARNEKRLNYHFSFSLTSINIAKGIPRNSSNSHEEIVLSVHDIKLEL